MILFLVFIHLKGFTVGLSWWDYEVESEWSFCIFQNVYSKFARNSCSVYKYINVGENDTTIQLQIKEKYMNLDSSREAQKKTNVQNLFIVPLISNLCFTLRILSLAQPNLWMCRLKNKSLIIICSNRPLTKVCHQDIRTDYVISRLYSQREGHALFLCSLPSCCLEHNHGGKPH